MKKHRSLSGMSAMVVVMSLFFSASAGANNFADTYGFSAQGIALGNAVTATVDDWASVYYNIAGLGRASHLRQKHSSTDGGEETEDLIPNEITIFYLYTIPQLDLHIPQRYYIDSYTGNTVPVATKAANDLNFGALVLGMALDLNKIIKFPDLVSSARFGLGTAVTELGSVTKVEDIDPRTHDFLRYGREAQKAVIVTGVGFGFLEDMFGFGLGINISFHGQAKSMLTSVDIGPTEQTPRTQSRLDLGIAPSVVTGFYTTIKRIGGSKTNLSVGVSYRQESYLEINPFVVRNITNAGNLDMTVDLGVFDYYTPHIVSLGAAATFGILTVSAQVDFELWSKFRVSKTMKKAFDDLQQEMAAAGDTRSYLIPSFMDIATPRLGITVNVLDWLDLMAGYYFQPTFVPEKAVKGVFNFLDNNRHVVSFGAKVELPWLDFLRGFGYFTVGCQFQILEDRRVDKQNDPNNSLNPSYISGGWNPTLAAELSLKF